jgi:hypothetical protein
MKENNGTLLPENLLSIEREAAARKGRLRRGAQK